MVNCTFPILIVDQRTIASHGRGNNLSSPAPPMIGPGNEEVYGSLLGYCMEKLDGLSAAKVIQGVHAAPAGTPLAPSDRRPPASVLA